MVWSDIEANMILRKTHVKTGLTVEHDLKLYPDILREIDLVDPSRRVGPMIISEATGEPYKYRTFTQTWRRVADAAELPKGVWNIDSRSGAISEAYDAGADETSVMKHAGHKNRQTSAKYNRGSLAQTSRVAHFRIENGLRTKPEGRSRDVQGTATKKRLKFMNKIDQGCSRRNCSLSANAMDVRQ